MTSRCVLCDELSGQYALSERLFRLRASPLVESAHFVAFPDIHPLVDGHTLVVTRSHIPAFSRVPAALAPELREVVERARSQITERHQAPFLFEHGPGEGPYPGCCVSHAHLHVIPLAAPVSRWLQAEVDGEMRRGRGDVLATLSAVRSSYLYYQSAEGEDFVVSDLECPVPDQFIRKAVAKFLGISDWNWKIIFTRPRGLNHEAIR